MFPVWPPFCSCQRPPAVWPASPCADQVKRCLTLLLVLLCSVPQWLPSPCSSHSITFVDFLAAFFFWWRSAHEICMQTVCMYHSWEEFLPLLTPQVPSSSTELERRQTLRKMWCIYHFPIKSILGLCVTETLRFPHHTFLHYESSVGSQTTVFVMSSIMLVGSAS